MVGESVEDSEEGEACCANAASWPSLAPCWHRPEEDKHNSPHNFPHNLSASCTDWAFPPQLRGQRTSLSFLGPPLGSGPPQGDPGCAVARRIRPARCQGRAINPQGQSLLTSGSDSNGKEEGPCRACSGPKSLAGPPAMLAEETQGCPPDANSRGVWKGQAAKAGLPAVSLGVLGLAFPAAPATTTFPQLGRRSWPETLAGLLSGVGAELASISDPVPLLWEHFRVVGGSPRLPPTLLGLCSCHFKQSDEE